MSFNGNELNLMFSDDQDIFVEIYGDFKNSLPDMINEIKVAIEQKNPQELQISAHTLKGVLSTFCAIESKEIAFELECMGRDASFNNAENKLNELESLVKILLSDLDNFSFVKAA